MAAALSQAATTAPGEEPRERRKSSVSLDRDLETLDTLTRPSRPARASPPTAIARTARARWRRRAGVPAPTPPAPGRGCKQVITQQ
jgi:hypothetical protein